MVTPHTPAPRGLWSRQADDLLSTAPLRQPHTYKAAELAQRMAFSDAARAVDMALAAGCSDTAYRLLLQRRALARNDFELHGSRPRIEACARRLAERLIGAGAGAGAEPVLTR